MTKTNQKIPSKWQIFEFYQIAHLNNKKYIPNQNEHLKCLELEHFEKETGCLIGYIDSAEQSSTKNVFKSGDVLFGKLRPYLKKFTKPDFNGVCSTEIWVLSGSNYCTNDYLYLLIQSPKFLSACNVSSGTHMPRADWDFVSHIPFSLPPLPEQEKIAEILGTWDTAIEKLSALIEQKKQLKKGLMQRLLTGKQRLPGFSDPWEKIAIRDFCDIKRGGSPRPIENYLTTSDDGLNWLKIGDISPDAKYIYKTESKIKKEGLSKTTLIHSGDFILSNSMSFGRPYIMRIEACIHDGWLALTNIKKDVSKEYLFYLLISSETQKKFEMCAAGSGVRNLNKDIVGEIRIKLPSPLEQKAIADILSKADEEIDLLTKKLSALKTQKTGLMQQLLTGKIRVKVA